jgi:hypothetical protein
VNDFLFRVLLPVLLILPMLSAGCGRVSQEGATRQVENDMKALHLMYVAFQMEMNRPPEKVEDLAPIKDKDQALYGGAYERLRKGEYVIKWGTPQDALSRAKLAGTELITPATGPGKARVALMGDGSVKRLEAGE